MVSVGFEAPFSERMALVGEIGGKFKKYRLSTDLQAIADPTIRGEMAEEVAKINDDLNDIRVTPFLSLGVSYRF